MTKPSICRLPDPRRLRAGDRIALDKGAAAEVSNVARLDGYCQVELRIDDRCLVVYVRPDGSVMSGPPLKLDRLFMSGAIK